MDGITLWLFVGALLAFFVGTAVVVANAVVAVFGRFGVSRGLNSIDTVYGTGADPDAPRASLLGHRTSRIGELLTPGPWRAWLRRRLDLAGNPPGWTEQRILEVKGLGLLALSLVGLFVGLGAGGLPGAPAGLVIGALVGFAIPDVILRDVSERRQATIRRTLPDILEMLTVSVEAGLGFDAALGQVTRYGRGPLAGEFARLLQEMRIGRSRVDALRALGRRTNVLELRSFCAIVVQTSELGVPVANVLREQAGQMRVRRRQRAEELAQKVPVKILFPLVFCLFPAIFVVVLGPGLINILDVFGP